MATRDGVGRHAADGGGATGSADAVQLLLDRGAPVDASDPAVRPHRADVGSARRNDATIMKSLIGEGCGDRGEGTRVGERPAVRPPGTGGGSHGVGIVRSGVPPQGEQQPTPGGMTPLLFAARDGLLDAARLLVEAGADVNRTDPNGITPLMMAITNGQTTWPHS